MTYLQIVNQVLRRMRQAEVASVTESTYSTMIADFVNARGGGLLMLGGRFSFAEGGYGGTPVAA